MGLILSVQKKRLEILKVKNYIVIFGKPFVSYFNDRNFTEIKKTVFGRKAFKESFGNNLICTINGLK